MRQVWITKAGPPDVLQPRDGPTPQPAPGEVRIAVEAIGVNFADLVGRLGVYRDAPKIPFVPGYEVTGRVDALGAGVDETLRGQPVIALAKFGGYGEMICVPTAQTFARPAAMPVEQAAAFSVSYLTAYAGLVAHARIQAGDHVLIHAAAGGLGLAAVAIARRAGATIYGTASPGKHAFLRAQGVQHPIDYRSQDFERVVMDLTGGCGVQIALDSIGGRSWTKSYRALAPTGRLVITGVTALAPRARRSWRDLLTFMLTTPWLRFNPASLANDNKSVSGVNMATLWDQTALLRGWMDRLMAWYADGDLPVHVDRVFPLDAAADAHRYLHERRNTGKVVLTP